MTSLSFRTVMAQDSFTDSYHRLALTHVARTHAHTHTLCIYTYMRMHASTTHTRTIYDYIVHICVQSLIHTTHLSSHKLTTHINNHNHLYTWQQIYNNTFIHTRLSHNFIDTMHINFHTFGSVHFNRNTLRLA